MKWIVYILCLVHILSIIRKRVVDKKNAFCNLIVQKHSFYLLFEDNATHELYYSGSHITIRILNVVRGAPHTKVGEWFAKRIILHIETTYPGKLPYWLKCEVKTNLPTRCRSINELYDELNELYDELILASYENTVKKITNEFKNIVLITLNEVSL